MIVPILMALWVSPTDRNGQETADVQPGRPSGEADPRTMVSRLMGYAHGADQG